MIDELYKKLREEEYKPEDAYREPTAEKMKGILSAIVEELESLGISSKYRIMQQKGVPASQRVAQLLGTPVFHKSHYEFRVILSVKGDVNSEEYKKVSLRNTQIRAIFARYNTIPYTKYSETHSTSTPGVRRKRLVIKVLYPRREKDVIDND